MCGGLDRLVFWLWVVVGSGFVLSGLQRLAGTLQLGLRPRYIPPRSYLGYILTQTKPPVWLHSFSLKTPMHTQTLSDLPRVPARQTFKLLPSILLLDTPEKQIWNR